MDDIIVFSPTFEAHVADLKSVFKRLADANVKLNPSKCEFFRNKINYLGHVISTEGIQPNPDKIQAILNKRSPSCITELRTWLGITGFYRQYIPRFPAITAPLFAMIHVGERFRWSVVEEDIIQRLKQYLTTEPILRFPNFDYPFTVRTDACMDGLGGTLSQEINGIEYVVQYISRAIQPAERKWPPRELEALGIMWACETFRPYIIGTRFLVETDHQSSKWLMQAKTPRLIRWACRLIRSDTSRSDTARGKIIEAPMDFHAYLIMRLVRRKESTPVWRSTSN
jgi:hypothetical protein